MPKADFTTKQNDTTGPIELVARGADKQPVDLTGATITFSMRPRPAGTVKVNKASATAVGTATLGRMRYNLTASDRDTADIFEGEFEIVYSNGTIQTVPSRGYIIIDVQDDIA